LLAGSFQYNKTGPGFHCRRTRRISAVEECTLDGPYSIPWVGLFPPATGILESVLFVSSFHHTALFCANEVYDIDQKELRHSLAETFLCNNRPYVRMPN